MLRPAQNKALRALLEGGDIEDAAQAANRTRRTVHRWLNDPDFREALAQAEAGAIQDLTRKLAGMGDKALEALKDALDDDEIAVKLRGADVHLKHLVRLRELLVGTKSKLDVDVGLSEEVKQILGKIIALAAACITEPDKLEQFRQGLKGQDNGSKTNGT